MQLSKHLSQRFVVSDSPPGVRRCAADAKELAQHQHERPQRGGPRDDIAAHLNHVDAKPDRLGGRFVAKGSLSDSCRPQEGDEAAPTLEQSGHHRTQLRPVRLTA